MKILYELARTLARAKKYQNEQILFSKDERWLMVNGMKNYKCLRKA